ncbi:hypothetical protein C8Q80DRAFT_1265281 [Daedaleopsis nitida]|nr:hypothetical protein C8Q80DRAFT_1265281 [Daedaleopsis nitida]
MYSVSDTLAAAPAPIGSTTSGRSGLPQPAEMLDDDNFAWGRPSRKQRHLSSKSRRTVRS